MLKILVVDDDEALRPLLEQLLTALGHDVTSAANGKEAVRMLEQGPLPSLVITDLVMPEQEGIETISIIRERYPNVKIIAMSGGGSGNFFDYLPSAAAMGAHETLPKPFAPRQLAETIARVCESSP